MEFQESEKLAKVAKPLTFESLSAIADAVLDLTADPVAIFDAGFRLALKAGSHPIFKVSEQGSIQLLFIGPEEKAVGRILRLHHPGPAQNNPASADTASVNDGPASMVLKIVVAEALPPTVENSLKDLGVQRPEIVVQYFPIPVNLIPQVSVPLPIAHFYPDGDQGPKQTQKRFSEYGEKAVLGLLKDILTSKI